MKQKKNTCCKCPFHPLNWNQFKPDIFDHVKEKARGSLYRCHVVGDVCNGYVKEAQEREYRDVIVLLNDDESIPEIY